MPPASRHLVSLVVSALLAALWIVSSTVTARAGLDGCTDAYKELAAKPKYRAMAVSEEKNMCWFHWGFSSSKLAERELLAYCRKKANDCRLLNAEQDIALLKKQQKEEREKEVSDIKQAQTKLKELGLYSGKIDGKRGPGTIAAIKAFQRKRQIFESGELNTSTMYELSRANPSILAREALCRAALNSDKSSWDTRSNFATHVQEAQKRNLSVDDCRVAIGMSKLKMAMSEPNQSSGAEFRICMSALNVSKRDWDTKPQFSQNVQEAKRRGLSVDDCRTALGLMPLSQDQVSVAEDAQPQAAPKLLSLNKICEQSLSADRMDWNSATSATEARKQADALGITLLACQSQLGIKTEQKIADTPDTSDQTAENNILVPPTTPLQKKVALVIGNSNYQHSPVLANPLNDAEAVASALSGLGFEVIKGLDLGNSETVARVREFAKAAKTADLSLLYYAGHGLQIAGENYIVPVDAVVEDETAISFELINVSTITNFMGGLDKIGLVLLDACRDNPFSRSLKRSLSASRAASVEQGLAPISAEGGGLFVAFSTAPGDVAADGEGMANSPFTTALLKHLPTKGLEINTVMTRVKAEVAKMTKNDQRPWTNSDLTTEVYLAPVQ